MASTLLVSCAGLLVQTRQAQATALHALSGSEPSVEQCKKQLCSRAPLAPQEKCGGLQSEHSCGLHFVEEDGIQIPCAWKSGCGCFADGDLLLQCPDLVELCMPRPTTCEDLCSRSSLVEGSCHALSTDPEACSSSYIARGVWRVPCLWSSCGCLPDGDQLLNCTGSSCAPSPTVVPTAVPSPVPTAIPNPSPAPSPMPPTPPPTSPATFELRGRQLLADGQPLHLKGVNWNPVPRGGMHPWDLDYTGFVRGDSLLMQAAGINAVRTYEPLTDRRVLDSLWSRGIYVLNTVYAWGGAAAEAAVAPVLAVKDHPAILMWVVGNEWNYNGLYMNMNLADSTMRVREVVRLVKQNDPSRPVATVFGELPSVDLLQTLHEVDIWGINAYRGIGFGNLFTDWEALSGKPMFLGEYGADAFDGRVAREDQAAQAEATSALTLSINAHSSVATGGVCLGGLIFEFADEWWKDGTGDVNSHDIGGIAPGGGPHPDGIFNEEWWGLVDIERKPRHAYRAFADIPNPMASMQ